MSTFSQEMDLSELAADTKARLGKACLRDKLFVFASLASSPDPDELAREAEETLRTYPLSRLFAGSHHDRESKVIYRARGLDDDKGHADALNNQIAQAETLRRKIVVAGAIDIARVQLAAEHHISQDALTWLLQNSPAIPPDLVGTFALGFTRFFQGDLTGAIYILAPLLEALLRHVLKSCGHDVTTFDDATQTQEDRTISSMFDQMRDELDGIFGRALTTDLHGLFLSKPGPHLRHAVAHGLLHDGSPYSSDAVYGCCLLFRICMVPLFPHREKIHLPPDWL